MQKSDAKTIQAAIAVLLTAAAEQDTPHGTDARTLCKDLQEWYFDELRANREAEKPARPSRAAPTDAAMGGITIPPPAHSVLRKTG